MTPKGLLSQSAITIALIFGGGAATAQKAEKVEDTAQSAKKNSKKGKASQVEILSPPPPAVSPPMDIPPPTTRDIGKKDSKDSKKKKKRGNRWSRYDVLVSEDGKTLHVVGSIMPGIVPKFKKQLKENPDVTGVLLSSNGGSVIHGMALGNIVARRKLDTHVDFVCASACTLVFAQGVNRTVGPNGSLGFHRSYRFRPSYEIEKEDGKRKDNAGNQAVEAFYAEAGVSDVIIKRTLETPSRTMWFPSQALLTKEKLVNAVTPGPGNVSAKGDWIAFEEVEKTIADKAIWQVARNKRPEYYRGSLSNFWIRAIILQDIEKAEKEAQQRLLQSLFSDVPGVSDNVLRDFIALQNDIWKYAETQAGKEKEPAENPIAKAAALAAQDAAEHALETVEAVKQDAKKDDAKGDKKPTEAEEETISPPVVEAIDSVEVRLEEESDKKNVHRKFLRKQCSGRFNSRVFVRMPQSDEHKARWSKLVNRMLSYPQLKRELTAEEKQKNEVALLGFYGLLLARDDVTTSSVRYQICKKSPEIFDSLINMSEKRRLGVMRALFAIDNVLGRHQY